MTTTPSTLVIRRYQRSQDPDTGKLPTTPAGQRPDLHIIAFGPLGWDEAHTTDPATITPYLQSWPVTWINLEGTPPPDMLDELTEVFTLHPMLVEDIHWNLFLAWIPYLAALWMAAQHRLAPRHWVIHLLPGAVWLAFFPNAPYILTDLLHLHERPPIGIWYDIGLLVAFAFTGCFLGIASLRTVQLIVKDHLGRVVSWLVVCIAIALGGFGVYIGRYLRWNSWDLLFNTEAVARDILNHVLHPLAHARAYGVTLMFAAIFFVAYLMYATTHATTD